MTLRPTHPGHFLGTLLGTEPLRDYCQARGIPFDTDTAAVSDEADARRWAAALAELPHEEHDRIERELAAVEDLSGADGVDHLLEADAASQAPALVPAGAPLALWYALHQPVLFRTVHLQHQIEAVEIWRHGRATPGLDLGDLAAKAGLLAEGVRTFLRTGVRNLPCCRAEASALADGCFFDVRAAERLRFLDTFGDDGLPLRQKVRPARSLLFVYRPDDGSVLLSCPLRSCDRIAGLFALFGQAVLGSAVVVTEVAFDLDRLKEPFHPLPDAPDVERVRLKALHLRYPARAGQRLVKLESHASDRPAAIAELLAAHVRAHDAPDLRVSYAELQVDRRVEAGRKTDTIRLWVNRSNLPRSPLGDRYRAALVRWGLYHA
jgi:hypothetical protein